MEDDRLSAGADWTERLGELGATAVEYALMVSFIAVVVIAGALALGDSTNDQLDCTASSLTDSTDRC